MIGRRQFMAGAGAVTVAFGLQGCFPVIPSRPEATSEAALGWISGNGMQFTLTLPRAEMGQNISTGLKQIAADALNVPWQRISVTQHDTLAIGGVRATVGSDSVKDYAGPLRQACDALQQNLQQQGITIQVSDNETPYQGRAVPGCDVEDIIRGRPLFASDQRLPGMVFGRVLRAPVTPELASRPKSWNVKAASTDPAFVQVVQDERLMQGESMGLGVVANTPGALDRLEALLDISWEIDSAENEGTLQQTVDIDHRLRQGELSHMVLNEDPDSSAPWDVDLRVDIPAAAHGFIEARTALARFENGRLDVWAGTQDAFYVRDVLADQFDLEDDQVCVHNHRVGGAFGGKTICTVELEAGILAQQAGKPVKVQWKRRDELRYGFHRPPSSHRVRARLQGGRITDWWHGFASGHILFTNAAMPPWLQNLVDVIGDKGVARGAVPPYDFVRRRIEHDQIRLPILTGPWRGLGAGQNSIALECTMDECARAADIEPVAFRLKHISDPRLAHVLSRVVELAGDLSNTTSMQIGRGFACGIYKDMSYVAISADVAVAPDGTIKVARMACVHDCGDVINPNSVQAQCEGNLMWGLGMVLHDHLEFSQNVVQGEGFDAAPLCRYSNCPDLQIELVKSTMPASGAGETAIAGAAAAILNGVRDAIGKRPDRLPLTPERIRKLLG